MRKYTKWLFIELPHFTRIYKQHFSDDTSYANFQRMLADNPELGKVIPRCGSLRKIRWGDEHRNKGKRGGIRIIYLHIPEIQEIILITVYNKDQQDNLSANQSKELKVLAEILRKERLR